MHNLNFFFVSAFWLLFTLLFTTIIVRAPFGLFLKATKHNPERVKAVGVNPRKIQIIAFVLSGVITGLAGALYTDLNRFVSPSVLGWQMSGELIVFIILGLSLIHI